MKRCKSFNESHLQAKICLLLLARLCMETRIDLNWNDSEWKRMRGRKETERKRSLPWRQVDLLLCSNSFSIYNSYSGNASCKKIKKIKITASYCCRSGMFAGHWNITAYIIRSLWLICKDSDAGCWPIVWPVNVPGHHTLGGVSRAIND